MAPVIAVVQVRPHPQPGNFPMVKVQPKTKSRQTKNLERFPLWLTRLRTQQNIHEGVGSIPGLAAWVKGYGVAVAVV